jgi:tRNA pseudouridine13 synthase
MFERARPLTASEAESGQYTIFDVVLPLPGFDVEYPANACGEWYKTFMASEEGGQLDPHNMRRKQKDFSLSGGYRKVLARIGETYDVAVHAYSNEDEQFIKTDMDKIKEGANAAANGDASGRAAAENGNIKDDMAVEGESDKKLAAVLTFQLGSSQYATMALRELSKGGIESYRPEYMGGR